MAIKWKNITTGALTTDRKVVTHWLEARNQVVIFIYDEVHHCWQKSVWR